MNFKTNKPPGIAEWLLRKIANRTEKNAIIGDLEEEYNDIINKQGIMAL